MSRLRERYGASPWHLAAALASFGVAGWALHSVLSTTGRPERVVLWLLGAIVLHDLVLFPLYSAAGRLLQRGLASVLRDERLRTVALNHLRVPAFLSGLMLLVWFPLIARKAPRTFENGTALSVDPYLGRWLLLTATLFVASAVVFALRARGLRR
jgi:hypothetical protein